MIADNRGQEIFFEDIGTGLPLVLGHSFLCSGQMWREQVRALSPHYRIINIDLRGHGRSARVRLPYSLYDAVDDTLTVLDRLRVERAVWCGLSIGGMVALRAALRHPDRVIALIVLDADAGSTTLLRKLKYRVMAAGARAFGMDPFLPAITRLMFGSTTRRENPTLVAEWHRIFSRVDIPSALYGLEALMARDSVEARLYHIDVPALVMVGGEDRSCPPVLSRRIHESLRDSTLTVVVKAGHLSALEQPEVVNEAILAFLTARLS